MTLLVFWIVYERRIVAKLLGDLWMVFEELIEPRQLLTSLSLSCTERLAQSDHFGPPEFEQWQAYRRKTSQSKLLRLKNG
jgi:hypothetical protein